MTTLADKLRAWAKDDTHNKAAVELLIAHDFWLRREDFIEVAVEKGAGFARINWRRAGDYSDIVQAPTSAIAVLFTACLIGADMANLNRLDRTNRALVVKAFADALGVER